MFKISRCIQHQFHYLKLKLKILEGKNMYMKFIIEQVGYFFSTMTNNQFFFHLTKAITYIT